MGNSLLCVTVLVLVVIYFEREYLIPIITQFDL